MKNEVKFNLSLEEEDNMNNNDDFSLYLGLLRKKKQFLKEKTPYYIEYNVKKFLLRNEKEEERLKEDVEVDKVDIIDNFINDFIEN